jgi:ABC-type branched-subunit amino acid transport system ATPase component
MSSAPTIAPDPSRAAPAAGDGVLAVREVHKAFAGTKALQGVSLELPRGRTVGLIGPNGSGKTTLLNVISGTVRPDAGSVLVDGAEVAGRSASRRARHGVARTFQSIRLFGDLTVAEHCEVALVALPRSHRRRMWERVGEVLDLLGLTEHARRVAATLPYGHQRRVELARAAVAGPRYLLLDEPAAGMNPAETAELVAAIRALRERFGFGVLVVEHDLGFVAELCDDVEVLDAGRCIARGPLDAVRRDPAVIEAYIGSGSTPAPRVTDQQGPEEGRT